MQLLASLAILSFTTRPVLPPKLAAPPAISTLRSARVAMDSEGDFSKPPEAFVGSTFGSTSAVFYRQGTLVLEDGTRLRGVSFGFEDSIAGATVVLTPRPRRRGYPKGGSLDRATLVWQVSSSSRRAWSGTRSR